MEPEVVMNLWVFIQLVGPMQVIHELGVRPYVMRGSDDEMTRLLKALSISDFHFARRFPLPDRYYLEIKQSDGWLRPGTGDTWPQTPGTARKGLALVNPMISGMGQMEYFKEALDVVEKSPPIRRLGTDGAQITMPKVNRKNLLSVITSVAVDEQGGQVAQVDDPRRSQVPSVATNLWMFHDDKANAIYALSGRGYMIHGSENDRTRVLKTLAPIDFPMAASLPIPDKFSADGTIAGSPDNSYNRDLFDDVYGSIDREVTTAVGIGGKVKNTVTVATRQSMSIATQITEHANKAAEALSVSLV